MIIRYFGAAQAAAGLDEETLELPDGTTLEALLREVVARHSPVESQDRVLAAAASGGGAVAQGAPPRAASVAPGRSSAPSMESVIARSSFLRNEVAWKDRQAPLKATDVIDILPPFAGG
ncbi:MoaD/ThiS family protein [Arthrobacter sulfonylureivorans]|uniref:MoaD/ThiS family protein n=1 Tax=Arthrobacter sulfonylureivorans TaxID=2486855 RepID=A0ABY3W3U2_9MICC|nr:MoaD/ThiS family protein [Arthrobacter sulfonylureivorans]UNK44805.1 MoaD/ThiS family protein [Arthrobacter sulfonylureivorans]